MSLVNSFINQIGRELGRDAYRSVVSGASKPSPTKYHLHIPIHSGTTWICRIQPSGSNEI